MYSLDARLVLGGILQSYRDGLQVYACLAEELPEEACHALLIELLEDISKDATEDVTWATAEAISTVDTAMTMQQKAGGSEKLSSSLLSALQR